MKKMRSLRLILVMLGLLSGLWLFSVTAMAGDARLVDEISLLTPEEQQTLEARLDEISEEYQTDVVVVIVDSIGTKTPTAYADDYYDSHDYGYGADADGILFLLTMQERKWAISTTGDAIDVFTDAGQRYMKERFVPYLSDAEYAKAFTEFADLCEQFLEQAENGNPYDTNHMPKEPMGAGMIILGIVIGAVLAALVVWGMKRQLKSVRPEPGAANYIRQGSFDVSQRSDIFLYDRVTRVRKPKERSGGSSTHVGSSGTSHGGSSGSF